MIYQCRLIIYLKTVIKNHSAIITFILLGLTDDPQLQIFLSVFLFLTYIFTVARNLTIILLTLVDSHLKIPLYIFLRNFSILQLIFTTVCMPRFLYSMTTGDKHVTYNACITQLFFCYTHRGNTVMMNERICTILVLCYWLTGLIVILPPLSLGVQLDFCNSSLIDHFGCDASSLLQTVCSDTQFVEQFMLIMAVLTLIFTLVCVIVSYTYILKTILRLPSIQQKKKAFSTCSSHMIVVSITYGSCIFIYIKPAKGVAINKVVSLLNTSVILLMNPFIYKCKINKSFTNVK